MPYKEKPLEKKYYTIGEVADELDVATSLIRFWETEFKQLTPKKNRKGNRQYTKADREVLATIYHLVKEKGYTLQGARDKLAGKSEKTFDEWMELLPKRLFNENSPFVPNRSIPFVLVLLPFGEANCRLTYLRLHDSQPHPVAPIATAKTPSLCAEKLFLALKRAKLLPPKSAIRNTRPRVSTRQNY